MTEDSRKKLNTLIFVLVATVLNLILMILFLVIGMVLLVKFANPDNVDGNAIWMMVVFISSIALASFIYSRVLRFLSKKYNLESHFAPFLGGRKGGRRPVDDDIDSGVKG